MLHTLRGSRLEPASKDNSRYVPFVTTSGLLMRDVEQADWRLWQRDNREVCCLGGHNSQRLQFSFVQGKKNLQGSSPGEGGEEGGCGVARLTAQQGGRRVSMWQVRSENVLQEDTEGQTVDRAAYGSSEWGGGRKLGEGQTRRTSELIELRGGGNGLRL